MSWLKSGLTQGLWRDGVSVLWYPIVAKNCSSGGLVLVPGE